VLTLCEKLCNCAMEKRRECHVISLAVQQSRPSMGLAQVPRNALQSHQIYTLTAQFRARAR
jgi:hypothetical protein